MPRAGVLRMWNNGDDHIANAIYWRGWDGHEPEMPPLFLGACQSARVVVDVGANTGYYSCLAALANPSALVVAIEAVPAHAHRLRANLELTGVADRTRVAELAVGHSAGEIRFDGPTHGIAHGARPLDADAAPLHGELVVSMTTIDDLLGELAVDVSDVEVVKLDIEGGEADALLGATRLLQAGTPLTFCEVLNEASGERVQDILGPHGYTAYRLTPAGAELITNGFERLGKSLKNYLFVPPGRSVPEPILG